MRTLLLAAAIALAAPVAYAQTSAPATQASTQHLAVAREAASLLLVDSGALELAFDQTFALLGPTLREQVRATPFYQGLSAQGQSALVAYLDTDFPIMFDREVDSATPAMMDYAAARLAPIFSEQELRDIKAFMTNPAVQEQYRHGVVVGVYEAAGQTPPPAPAISAETAAIVAAFEQTPSGQAFTTRANQVSVIMEETIRNGLNIPHFQRLMVAGMCQAVGSECPPQLRAAGQAQ